MVGSENEGGTGGIELAWSMLAGLEPANVGSNPTFPISKCIRVTRVRRTRVTKKQMRSKNMPETADDKGRRIVENALDEKRAELAKQLHDEKMAYRKKAFEDFIGGDDEEFRKTIMKKFGKTTHDGIITALKNQITKGDETLDAIAAKVEKLELWYQETRIQICITEPTKLVALNTKIVGHTN